MGLGLPGKIAWGWRGKVQVTGFSFHHSFTNAIVSQGGQGLPLTFSSFKSLLLLQPLGLVHQLLLHLIILTWCWYWTSTTGAPTIAPSDDSYLVLVLLHLGLLRWCSVCVRPFMLHFYNRCSMQEVLLSNITNLLCLRVYRLLLSLIPFVENPH